MLAREVPYEQWVNFFDNFSRQHQGWIVKLEVLGSNLGDQEESTLLPLVGISADVKNPGRRIEVMIGHRPDAHLTHIINKAKRIWFKQPEEQAHEAIEVESEDGTTTLVHFVHGPLERQLPEKA